MVYLYVGIQNIGLGASSTGTFEKVPVPVLANMMLILLISFAIVSLNITVLYTSTCILNTTYTSTSELPAAYSTGLTMLKILNRSPFFLQLTFFVHLVTFSIL